MIDAIYLTTEEIEKLHKVKLTGTMAAVRDRFVIGCVTGLRFSDYSRFGPGHLQNGIITILTQKTNRKVVIPAHPFVIDILRRNKNDIPPANTLRYYNMILPRIGSKAGIRTPVKIERLVAGTPPPEEVMLSELVGGMGTKRYTEVKAVTLPKHDLISTHTARRSFATNAYLAGIKPAKIMLITGHTTENSFFKYIRIGGAENAKELKEHEFFK